MTDVKPIGSFWRAMFFDTNRGGQKVEATPENIQKQYVDLKAENKEPNWLMKRSLATAIGLSGIIVGALAWLIGAGKENTGGKLTGGLLLVAGAILGGIGKWWYGVSLGEAPKTDAPKPEESDEETRTEPPATEPPTPDATPTKDTEKTNTLSKLTSNLQENLIVNKEVLDDQEYGINRFCVSDIFRLQDHIRIWKKDNIHTSEDVEKAVSDAIDLLEGRKKSLLDPTFIAAAIIGSVNNESQNPLNAITALAKNLTDLCKPTIGFLSFATEHEHSACIEAAVWALNKCSLDNKDVKEALLSVLQERRSAMNEHPSVRVGAILALGKINAIEELTKSKDFCNNVMHVFNRGKVLERNHDKYSQAEQKLAIKIIGQIGKEHPEEITDDVLISLVNQGSEILVDSIKVVGNIGRHNNQVVERLSELSQYATNAKAIPSAKLMGIAAVEALAKIQAKQQQAADTAPPTEQTSTTAESNSATPPAEVTDASPESSSETLADTPADASADNAYGNVIQRLYDPQATFTEVDIPLLTRALSSDLEHIRSAAANILGQFGIETKSTDTNEPPSIHLAEPPEGEAPKT